MGPYVVLNDNKEKMKGLAWKLCFSKDEVPKPEPKTQTRHLRVVAQSANLRALVEGMEVRANDIWVNIHVAILSM